LEIEKVGGLPPLNQKKNLEDIAKHAIELDLEAFQVLAKRVKSKGY
jgi:hypothetical protein